MADLRALGAHRLMRVMTVPEAIEFTARQRRGSPLFATAADWYRAKRRAQKVIDRYFWR